jgi:hypothetical protein
MTYVAPLAAALFLAAPPQSELNIAVEPGVAIDQRAVRQFLGSCAQLAGHPGKVTLRIVRPSTLNALAPTPAGKIRLGRTYRPKKPGQPSIIYVAKTRGFWRTLAHEWAHAVDFSGPEHRADELAERCLNASAR